NELIASELAAGKTEQAFVHSELARAFEPMQILLQSGSIPPGYRAIETVADLEHARSQIPEDTAILQFLVLPQGTHEWALTREAINAIGGLRPTKERIGEWLASTRFALEGHQNEPFKRVMRAVYAELFREPLKAAGPSKTHIVIVPDEPMQGFPFNG